MLLENNSSKFCESCGLKSLNGNIMIVLFLGNTFSTKLSKFKKES